MLVGLLQGPCRMHLGALLLASPTNRRKSKMTALVRVLHLQRVKMKTLDTRMMLMLRLTSTLTQQVGVQQPACKTGHHAHSSCPCPRYVKRNCHIGHCQNSESSSSVAHHLCVVLFVGHLGYRCWGGARLVERASAPL